MRWLAEGSAAAVAGALREAAPELGGLPVVMAERVGQTDPRWWAGSAIIGGRFVAKFAWSQIAARRLRHEIAVLAALASDPAIPFLPEVVAASTDPLILVTRLVPGSSLFDVAGTIDRDRAGRQLARFLGALHQPATRARVEAVAGELPGAHVPATTDVLRDRLGRWVRPDQRPVLDRWYDWADATLALARPQVLVHADFHGDNQVWDHDQLRLVLDFETAASGEPEYELRVLPGPGMGPGGELLTATMRHYQELTGRRLDLDRLMAWHLRGALGDVLWRREAGLPLADHRTPAQWVEDLAVRFGQLGIDPSG